MLLGGKMCQATVYLIRDGQEREIMRDVILLEPIEEGLRLQAFFEESVVLQARIGRIDFLKHTVSLLPAEGG
jgi:predicted RNA-binding protein